MLKRSDSLRKIQVPIMAAAMSMVPMLLVFGLLVPSRIGLVWLQPIAFMILALICLLLSGKNRLFWGCVGAVLLLGLGLLVGGMGGSLWFGLTGLLYALMLIACLPVAAWEWHEEPPTGIYILGLGSFLSFHILTAIFHTDRNHIPFLPEGALRNFAAVTGNAAAVSFLVFVRMVLLSLSRRTLNAAVSHRHRASVNVRNKNRTLVLIFFGVVTLLVASPAIMDALWSVVLWVIGVFRWLRELLRDDSAATIPSGTLPPPDIGEMPPADQTPFGELLTEIFVVVSQVLFFVAMAVLFGLLVYRIMKLMRKRKKLSEKAGRYLASAGEDYEEEITDIRDRDHVDGVRGVSDLFGVLREGKMPPNERVRYRYKRLLWKHSEWTEEKTARENLPEGPAGLYERARYSRQELTEEEAKAFIADSKRL